jgi:uncharacterized protein (DUF58 family)
VGGIVVLAIGNGLAVGEPALSLLAAFGVAMIVLGVVGAVWVVRDLRVALSSPSDAVVGSEVEIGVTIGRTRPRAIMISSPCEVRLLDPATEWHAAEVGEHGVIMWRAPRRGVVTVLRAEVRSSWPFGMFQRRRSFTVPLRDPLHVAPRPIATPYDARAANGDGVQPHATISQPGDLVRSVRPYQAGDPQRLVHWPSTARTGELMVREFEPPATHGVTVRLTLASDPTVSEPAASRACGFGQSVLRSGHALVLSTREATGDVSSPVITERELARRLARAVTGTPASSNDPTVVEMR